MAAALDTLQAETGLGNERGMGTALENRIAQSCLICIVIPVLAAVAPAVPVAVPVPGLALAIARSVPVTLASPALAVARATPLGVDVRLAGAAFGPVR